ncbi:MAG: hypothetical protein ABII01_06665 [Candidatus Woesearchaeota archaeon]
MKKIIVIVVILSMLMLIGCNRTGGIGPSPDFVFTIENTQDYPEFSFYYTGRMMEDKIYTVEDINQMYKLDTFITIYAVPKELGEKHGLVLRRLIKDDGLKSEEISLNPGKTIFKITSFDKDNKIIQLEVLE